MAALSCSSRCCIFTPQHTNVPRAFLIAVMRLPQPLASCFLWSSNTQLPISVSDLILELPPPTLLVLVLTRHLVSSKQLIKIQTGLLIPPLILPSSSGTAILPVAQAKKLEPFLISFFFSSPGGPCHSLYKLELSQTNKDV